ncbi:MAG: c-type cytochrome biogenesis protein CcmI, partial [Pseudomonadota bacterium]|nr:c-type cytochrome biogenesis protein CcmI [Pseudomonadota bacterium]
MFWIVTAGLFLLAALFVVGPLWLRASSQLADSGELRKQANIALFQERSDELEAELSAGNLDQQQFDLLLSELQLGLLADVELEEKAASSANVNPKNASNNQGALESLTTPTFLVPLAFVVALPVLAYGLYSHWGYIDEVQVMDLFQRTVDNQEDSNETRELIVALGELAQTNPDMPWAFYFLAENFAAVGLFEEAQIAYQRAADLLDATPEKALVLGR